MLGRVGVSYDSAITQIPTKELSSDQSERLMVGVGTVLMGNNYSNNYRINHVFLDFFDASSEYSAAYIAGPSEILA